MPGIRLHTAAVAARKKKNRPKPVPPCVLYGKAVLPVLSDPRAAPGTVAAESRRMRGT